MEIMQSAEAIKFPNSFYCKLIAKNVKLHQVFLKIIVFETVILYIRFYEQLL